MRVELSAGGKSFKVGVELYNFCFPNIFKVLFKNIFILLCQLEGIFWCLIFTDWTNFCLTYLLDVNLSWSLML